VEVLEKKIAGILSMIDEEINVPRGTDETLLNKILKTYAGSPLVKRFSLILSHPSPELEQNLLERIEISSLAS
jgi:myosin heavy subunit